MRGSTLWEDTMLFEWARRRAYPSDAHASAYLGSCNCNTDPHLLHRSREHYLQLSFRKEKLMALTRRRHPIPNFLILLIGILMISAYSPSVDWRKHTTMLLLRLRSTFQALHNSSCNLTLRHFLFLLLCLLLLLPPVAGPCLHL